jgi:thioredoxin reductase
MQNIYDIIIIGGGPGGVAAGILAQKAKVPYIILEKGKKVFQGIIDSYPKGKRVYPTIPKGESGPFPIEELEPPETRVPVEQYIDQMEKLVESIELNIRYEQIYLDVDSQNDRFYVKTDQDVYVGKNVIFAFGSNIPNDLGVYGEAKTVARNLENPEQYIGVTTLVIGGGNAAADIVAALSRIKRKAEDHSPVYWGHIREKFEINKDTARELGEEILLGGQIRVLQGAVPKIGEVDAEGIDRLYIHQSPGILSQDDVFVYQGMSFPMKNVIACIGSHGPASIFDKINLQQITCSGNICRIAREGERLLLLDQNRMSSTKGIYAVGGAISPSYMEIDSDGAIKERKHSNLIFTAIKDAVVAVESILGAGK